MLDRSCLMTGTIGGWIHAKLCALCDNKLMTTDSCHDIRATHFRESTRPLHIDAQTDFRENICYFKSMSKVLAVGRTILDKPDHMNNWLWQHIDPNFLAYVESLMYCFTRDQLQIYLTEYS